MSSKKCALHWRGVWNNFWSKDNNKDDFFGNFGPCSFTVAGLSNSYMQASIVTLKIEFGLPIIHNPSATIVNLEPIVVIIFYFFVFCPFIYVKHIFHISLKIVNPISMWYIARFSPNSTERCWVTQAFMGILGNAKMQTRKHGTFATYQEMEKNFRSTNNVNHGFWFSNENIKCHVSCNKREHGLPVGYYRWSTNVGVNIYRGNVLLLEYAMFE